ncbi:MAG: diguanylate cyclase [Betaproteobacteria bacterium]|nr:diguanylate cyclase [Betaproteobacteria bacterium]
MDAAFRRFAESCPDSIIVTDARGTVAFVNRAFERLSGYRRKEIVGRPASLLKSGVHSHDFYRRLWRTIVRGGEFRAVFTNRRKDGRRYCEERIVRPLDGDRRHFISYGRDATERAREERKLRHAATHDPLTDLPNRTLFFDRLQQALRQAVRRNEALTVVMLDIDDFRQANTRFGHAGGDALLKAVGGRTAKCLRQSDTVARLGGDEFALLLAGAGREEAALVLSKIILVNAQPIRYGKKSIAVTVSAGASCYPEDALREAPLLKLADLAMYRAKRSGGNRYVFASGGR